MDKEDGRNLMRQAQHERRKQAVRLHRRGMAIKDIARALEMAQGTVRSAIKVANNGGLKALVPKPTGGAVGQKRRLTAEQELQEPSRAIIAERARLEGAEIHWGDETAVVNNDVRGRGYSPKAQTPVAYAVGGTRHKLSMISTVPNQGKTRWMIVEDAFNSDKLIEFMDALISEAQQKIFLILDNLRVHHSKPVKAWLAQHTAQIEVFYLPSYSPDLNPDERLNADLK